MNLRARARQLKNTFHSHLNLLAGLILAASLAACSEKTPPESQTPNSAEARAETQNLGVLVGTDGLNFLSQPNGGVAVISSSSPALVLDSKSIESMTWTRLLLANSKTVWTRSKMSKPQAAQSVIYARTDDIDASNLPQSERGNEAFEWQDWAISSTKNALKVLESSDVQKIESLEFITAQGRSLREDDNIRALGAAAPFLWPQIKVNNGDAQSWISLSDVVLKPADSDTALDFKGLINPPFLSAALTQLDLPMPQGDLTFENLSLQDTAMAQIDASDFSVHQVIIAPEKTDISYILCLGNSRGDAAYLIQYINGVSRAIGFYDPEFRVSTPLVIGYESSARTETRGSELVLDILQISGDEQPLMRVFLDGAVTPDQESVVSKVEF